MMVIIRAEAIDRTSEAAGLYKVAAAPDSARENEPWQWRMTLATGQQAASIDSSNQLTLSSPEGAEGKSLELAIDANAVNGTLSRQSLSEETELVRQEGEIVAVYVSAGELAFGGHILGMGDAAIFSGGEHYVVPTTPLVESAEIGVVRLTSATETGLVWIP